MASGLITAGLISGFGGALKEMGLESQRAANAKELQAERIKAEDQRQERLIEAQRGMHRESLLSSEELQKGRFGQEEKMAERHEKFSAGLEQLHMLDRSYDRQLKGQELDLMRQKFSMEKGKVSTIQQADGTLALVTYDGTMKGVLTDPETKEPVIGMKDLPASILKEVDGIYKMIESNTSVMTHGFHTPEQLKAYEKKNQRLYEQANQLLRGGKGILAPGAASPTPTFAEAQAARQRGASSGGGATVPALEMPPSNYPSD